MFCLQWQKLFCWDYFAIRNKNVARKFSIGGIYVCAEEFDILKFGKTLLGYSVSYFNLGCGLVTLFGGSAHQ